MGDLRLQNLTIAYGPRIIIQGLSLTVHDGEMVSLLGPSGAGKTTILKAISGLLKPDGGDILIDGRSVTDLSPEKRDAVMVFQKPLLFPFMNVAQNIGFGLRMLRLTKSETRRRVARILALTRLEGLEFRKVHELSGGQQQRVALARALVLEPSVLLLDEPLSNLDASLRQRMRDLIQSIQTETRMTMVFVTHDQSEALMISHRVALLLDGHLRQVGTPRQLFYEPIDPDVARFFGGRNFFQGCVENGLLRSDLGVFPVGRQDGNGRLRVATIRPEDIEIAPLGKSSKVGLTGRIVKTNFEGSAIRHVVTTTAGELMVLTTQDRFALGQEVALTVSPNKIRLFPKS